MKYICSIAYAVSMLALAAPASATHVPASRDHQVAQFPVTIRAEIASPIPMKTKPDKYIYVSDIANEAVSVYPIGVPNAKRIRTISIPGIPGGMATDSSGNLYVAYSSQTADGILVYDSGGKQLTSVFNQNDNITNIRDITFDKNDTMYVTCEALFNNQILVGVAIFEKGALLPTNFYQTPTSQMYGLTLDGMGDLYVQLGMYTAIDEFVPNPPAYGAIVGYSGSPTPGGILFGNATTLIETGGNGMFISKPGGPGSRFPWVISEIVDYGTGVDPGYPAIDHTGTIYIPFNNGSDQHPTLHEVRVYAQQINSALPRQFTRYTSMGASDLKEPGGVAIGG
jgi:hypothetical protein